MSSGRLYIHQLLVNEAFVMLDIVTVLLEYIGIDEFLADTIYTFENF